MLLAASGYEHTSGSHDRHPLITRDYHVLLPSHGDIRPLRLDTESHSSRYLATFPEIQQWTSAQQPPTPHVPLQILLCIALGHSCYQLATKLSLCLPHEPTCPLHRSLTNKTFISRDPCYALKTPFLSSPSTATPSLILQHLLQSLQGTSYFTYKPDMLFTNI